MICCSSLVSTLPFVLCFCVVFFAGFIFAYAFAMWVRSIQNCAEDFVLQ